MMQRQEEINAHWSEGADNYNAIIEDEMNSFRTDAWKKQILDHAPPKGVLKILDCGCGPGFFSILMAQEGHLVTAVDGSERMLGYARARAEAYHVKVDFRKMDCHELEFPDETFDLIISRNLTHTLRAHRQVYREWNRVLKKGGILQIYDANWHHMLPGGREYEESGRRWRECMIRYGSDYNGNIYDGTESSLQMQEKEDAETSVWNHALHDYIRPDWDIGMLLGTGYENVFTDRDVTGHLWDDKEKLLYGNTPMFMIYAGKVCDPL